MYTKEKRAQMEADGEPWPECHGEPMTWFRNPEMIAGGHFVCRVRNRERVAARRAAHRAAGECVWCGGELETESLCADCAAAHRESSAKHDQGLRRQLEQYLHKQRRRIETSEDEATGVVFTAFLDWKGN